jgi:hypothetical protein
MQGCALPATSSLLNKKNYRMKKLLLLFGIFSVVLLTSCNNDDDFSIDSYSIQMATVGKIDGSSSTFYLNLDSGAKVWIAATNLPYFNPKDGQRIIASYSILSNGGNGYDHYVKLNDAYQVLTKPIISLTASNADSIGNDPIKITDVWIANHHLNVEFVFLGDRLKHMVNLAESSDFGSTPQIAKLQLRHNAYNDSPQFWLRGIASFKLRPLVVQGQQSRKIELSYTSFNGEQKIVELTYDWSDLVFVQDSGNLSLKKYSAVN